jgi:hypothetical protein
VAYFKALSRCLPEGVLQKVTVQSASQHISHVLCNQKVHYHVHNTLPHVSILSQMNPIHTFQHYSQRYILILYFTLRLGLATKLSPRALPLKCLYFSSQKALRKYTKKANNQADDGVSLNPTTSCKAARSVWSDSCLRAAPTHLQVAFQRQSRTEHRKMSLNNKQCRFPVRVAYRTSGHVAMSLGHMGCLLEQLRTITKRQTTIIRRHEW